jgi:hypothetical protein
MPSKDIVVEAMRVIEAAEAGGITLRLFGGMAIRLRCPSAKSASLERKYPDIDFFGYSKQSPQIEDLFMKLGYTPRDLFNRLHGNRRLVFNDMDNMRRVDVFLDTFEMCHIFDFRDRLKIDPRTLSLSDLLLTKLQIVEINEKDYKDMICMLKDYEIGDTDGEGLINGEYIAKLCSKDWGIFKTITNNLNGTLSFLSNFHLEEKEKDIIKGKIEKLQNQIENKPKSSKWRLRAIVGEKAAWYDLPDKDKPVVVSTVLDQGN